MCIGRNNKMKCKFELYFPPKTRCIEVCAVCNTMMQLCAVFCVHQTLEQCTMCSVQGKWSASCAVWSDLSSSAPHCPFVTIPQLPSSSSSSISIQSGKTHWITKVHGLNEDIEGKCISLQLFTFSCIQAPRLKTFWTMPYHHWRAKFVTIFTIFGREIIYMVACGTVWTWAALGEFWVNVGMSRKAGVAILHWLCNPCAIHQKKW